MSPFIRTASGWGIILTILVLVVTLLKQLIALVSFIITAIKVGIVVAFVGLMLLIVLAIFRGRRSRRREAEDI
jgi:predicted lysophospholipase L1 biosynthesis ABC-type transport system permease subunit